MQSLIFMLTSDILQFNVVSNFCSAQSRISSQSWVSVHSWISSQSEISANMNTVLFKASVIKALQRASTLFTFKLRLTLNVNRKCFIFLIKIDVNYIFLDFINGNRRSKCIIMKFLKQCFIKAEEKAVKLINI